MPGSTGSPRIAEELEATAGRGRRLHQPGDSRRRGGASRPPRGGDRRRARRSGSGSATAAAKRWPPGGSPSPARSTSARSGGSRRRRREAELQPQERLAAVLGARERFDSCETLLLRARADLDAGRMREAALQLRVGLEALLVELAGALQGPRARGGHGGSGEPEGRGRRGGGRRPSRRPRPRARAKRPRAAALCERVLRRRRVLRG